ncbi:hypothetical protein K353_04759 [Kitasatospora sp. SolWspMP-SS2h]|uniref:hypothetical protein n=1 Tax=Kitasatospora sp. SolWspMP-SS2h TaxID=1305729 RepID=UPI000DB967D7|nr:hypothetical protein [Kitasatospora sp. SolWspMP-SS2h]RAJ36024.1 hypothetical protein K353_04759 [Kitasatospora sp. SolWspMP-SS2h]
MSAVFLSLLLALIALTTAVLLHLRALARKLADRQPNPQWDEALIRRAVAEALAADREREITEARAFWAEQEARAAEDSPLFDTPFTTIGEDWPIFFPRPTGPQEAADNGVMDPEFGDALRHALEDLIKDAPADGGPAGGTRAPHPAHPAPPAHPAQGGGFPAPGDNGDVQARREADLLATGLEAGLLDAEGEPAAAPDPRRHPSHPDFIPSPTPSREWTDDRLAALAEERIALTDVRPGPLGTLDVYAFADGTTLCVAPGDREAAYRLIDAVRAGEDVRLLGGSRFSGSYSLTFSTDDETVYVLADRVVASI